MEITLNSDILTVKSILRKTKAKLFEDLKVGDRIKLSVDVTYAGRSSRGTYAKYIKVENVETGESVYYTFNQLPTILRAFEFE